MTNAEFSNEFDVLYNSITSNQAPGLDEYEKSVFLTKAQDEIVKSYFNPRSNKTQEGFDGNEKRQIDFSMIMRSKVYTNVDETYTIRQYMSNGIPASPINKPFIKDLDKEDIPIPLTDYSLSICWWKENGTYYMNCPAEQLMQYIDKHKCASITVTKAIDGGDMIIVTVGFGDSFFDLRTNTKSVSLDDDILMFINEYVEATRNGLTARLTVLPINYTEYSRLMSKPYKRPLKNQAWRLLDNSNGSKRAELVIGPNDTITKYVIRYVKRPRAIRLTTFDDVTLDGDATEQSCELDPILHPEILQRAVEFAKASYTGDLQSQIALGQTSQTNIGAVQTSR